MTLLAGKNEREDKGMNINESSDRPFRTRDRIRDIVLDSVAECQSHRTANPLPESDILRIRETVLELHEDDEIIWVLELEDLVSKFKHETPLMHLAIGIYGEIQDVLNDKDVRDLFDIGENDIDFHIGHWTHSLLVEYLNRLSISIHRSANLNCILSFVSIIKKTIEPSARSPKDGINEIVAPRTKFNFVKGISLKPFIDQFPNARFAILPQLEDTEEILAEALGSATTDKKAWFDRRSHEERVAEYEHLLTRYQDVFNRYSQEKEEFSKDCGENDGDWRNKWKEVCEIEFRELDLALEIRSFQGNERPAELAYRNLAQQYDYTPEYMKNLIKKSRGILKARRISLNRSRSQQNTR